MSKQKLEQYLKNSLKIMDCWFIKLQNSHFSKTPADFIVLSKTKRYLIECKQIEFKNMRSSFSFDRLTQKDELFNFKLENELNESLVMLMFWNKRLNNSYIYCIPIIDYMKIESWILDLGTKSLNMGYLDQVCKEFKVETKKGIMELKL